MSSKDVSLAGAKTSSDRMFLSFVSSFSRSFLSLASVSKQSLVRDIDGDVLLPPLPLLLIHKNPDTMLLTQTTVIVETNSEYTKDDNENFKTIIVFDCRGLEPVDVQFKDGWSIVSESNKTFENCNIKDGDWVEFDEKLKLPVTLYDMKAKFVKGV
uniref:Uncharacterized protein n=1 Tax=Timema genevievae TaxID=629358 RepID=A0A7R9JRB4_TIMGE|nr:unnamed protein product [Timema genevievae]